MKLIPLKNKVLVKKDKPEEETRGGIFLPDVSQKEHRVQTGVVVSVGAMDHECPVAVDDKVVVPAWEKGHAVVVDGEKFIVHDIADIQGVIES